MTPSLGDFKALARRLQTDPFAIGEPSVLDQLKWLKAFANFEELPQDQLEPLLRTEDGVAYFNAMTHGGRAALQEVLAGFVRGMLPPRGVHTGFTIQPVKRPARRGRKSLPGREWEEVRLMRAYCWIRSRLERLEHGNPLLWRRRCGETPDTHVERMALEVLQTVHTHSWLRKHPPFVERWLSEYRLDADGNVIGLLHPSERPMLTEALPPDVASGIARRVLQKCVDKNRLFYGLLAYYEGKTPDQIRGMVEDAKAERPQAFENCLATFRTEP